MTNYEKIIESLNSQIRDSIVGAEEDSELLKLIKIRNIHLELLANFMEYACNLDISKNFEVYMTRNWIHFKHKGEKVFVLSWTDKMEHEERIKLVSDIKSNRKNFDDVKYYLMIWGMNEVFKCIAHASKMEMKNDNLIVKNNSEVIELMNKYFEHVTSCN